MKRGPMPTPEDVIAMARGIEAKSLVVTWGRLGEELGINKKALGRLILAARKLDGWNPAWCSKGNSRPTGNHPWARAMRRQVKK